MDAERILVVLSYVLAILMAVTLVLVRMDTNSVMIITLVLILMSALLMTTEDVNKSVIILMVAIIAPVCLHTFSVLIIRTVQVKQ